MGLPRRRRPLLLPVGRGQLQLQPRPESLHQRDVAPPGRYPGHRFARRGHLRGWRAHDVHGKLRAYRMARTRLAGGLAVGGKSRPAQPLLRRHVRRDPRVGHPAFGCLDHYRLPEPGRPAVILRARKSAIRGVQRARGHRPRHRYDPRLGRGRGPVQYRSDAVRQQRRPHPERRGSRRAPPRRYSGQRHGHRGRHRRPDQD